jgi:hypothetical protein
MNMRPSSGLKFDGAYRFKPYVSPMSCFRRRPLLKHRAPPPGTYPSKLLGMRTRALTRFVDGGSKP